MDFSKYPFEKLFGFVAGIIPGFVAILIFQLAAPGSFRWFLYLGFLGYKTKLTFIILAAFIIGYSLGTFLSSLLGAIGGALGATVAHGKQYKRLEPHEVAPWRDPKWRIALKKYLGTHAPNDTMLLSPEVLELKGKIIDLVPEAERPAALARLKMEKLGLEIDDSNWEQWYVYYHSVVLFDDRKREIYWWVGRGLNFNLETAALYTVFSALAVPSLRHWWVILPASMWVLLLVAQQYSEMTEFLNKWSTLARQVEYLMAQAGLEEPALD